MTNTKDDIEAAIESHFTDVDLKYEIFHGEVVINLEGPVDLDELLDFCDDVEMDQIQAIHSTIIITGRARTD